MWRCKKCGGEVIEWEPVIKKRRILNNFYNWNDVEREFLHDDDTLPITYHCERCGSETKDDELKSLEDIADWGMKQK